jgi:hypothetical protein
MTTPIRLAAEDGLFELGGPHPSWIWVHTCPAPKCSCRTALILATSEGRGMLLDRGKTVREAWQAGLSYFEVAAKLAGVDAFALGIDTAEASALQSDEPLDPAAHPSVKDVLDRMDGEILDQIGRLWYRGKGLENPEETARLSKEILERFARRHHAVREVGERIGAAPLEAGSRVIERHRR